MPAGGVFVGQTIIFLEFAVWLSPDGYPFGSLVAATAGFATASRSGSTTSVATGVTTATVAAVTAALRLAAGRVTTRLALSTHYVAMSAWAQHAAVRNGRFANLRDATTAILATLGASLADLLPVLRLRALALAATRVAATGVAVRLTATARFTATARGGVTAGRSSPHQFQSKTLTARSSSQYQSSN